MRRPINLQNKLWPNRDGPFVVDYTDKDTYQLGSANGFIVRRLVTGEQLRLRKMSQKELRKYHREFWSASSRLKVYDECAKKENELQDAEMEMRKVALENMELQRIAAELKTKTNANAKAHVEACASMVRLGEASKEKKRREEEYRPRGAMVAETSVLRAESLPDQYAVAFIVVEERTISQRLVVDERMDDSRVTVVQEETEGGNPVPDDSRPDIETDLQEPGMFSARA
jgi:hypothetical protein